MSGRFVRHARSKWDHDTAPSRSSLRTEAVTEEERDPAKKAPARKDTRSWCKGKRGVEHVPVIGYDHAYPVFRRNRDCEWTAGWNSKELAYAVFWDCRHHEVCANCSKVLRTRHNLPDDECPLYPGDAEQRAEAEDEGVEAQLRLEAHAGRPHPRRRRAGGTEVKASIFNQSILVA